MALALAGKRVTGTTPATYIIAVNDASTIDNWDVTNCVPICHGQIIPNRLYGNDPTEQGASTGAAHAQHLTPFFPDYGRDISAHLHPPVP